MKRFLSFIKIKNGHLTMLGALFILLLISGCSSYQKNVSVSRSMMEQGKFDEGLEILKKKVDESQGDKLAYQLEYGTLLHQAKRYEESNKVFSQADKEAELNDYVSVTKEAAGIFVQEGLVQYKVDTFEFLLINVYKMLNYQMLNDYENAKVMARRINEKLVKLEVDEDSRRRYGGFAAYMAAFMWEAENDWDNAYVLYKKAHDLMPENEILSKDLLRAAKVSHRDMDYEKLKKQFPALDKEIGTYNRSQGEFIFIYQQGWIPRKQPRYDNHRFPMMVPEPSAIRQVRVEVDKVPPATGITDDSIIVFDLAKVAAQSLEDYYGKLLAKKIAGIATKAVLANQINKKNPGLGSLAFMALDAMDQADLRQWSTLPATFQLVRIPLNPGKHTVSIFAENSTTPLWTGEVEIKKNKKNFFTYRTF